MTPEQRTLRGKIGAYSLHAKHDSRIVSAPGRTAAAQKLNQQLLAEIDPEDLLPEAERCRRLEYARKAHFAKLALKSARTRSKKKAAVASGGNGDHHEVEARNDSA